MKVKNNVSIVVWSMLKQENKKQDITLHPTVNKVLELRFKKKRVE